ncbi:hypothetical protein KR100_10015 [Synechococcus sp. KORDI-100]|nr:hypothetical protein KR100_10015 [Synechococcus sp. KORDI-100]
MLNKLVITGPACWCDAWLLFNQIQLYDSSSVQKWQSLRSPMERYLAFWSEFNLIDR